MKEVRKRADRLKAFRMQERAEEQALRSALDDSLKQGDAVIVAKKLGISYQYLSDIRKGNRGISTELLEKLCEVEG
jgi:transcriptional regulator with XRE-family HTH domain